MAPVPPLTTATSRRGTFSVELDEFSSVASFAFEEPRLGLEETTSTSPSLGDCFDRRFDFLGGTSALDMAKERIGVSRP